eukprot:3802575-Prymnesium_polylepis.1
MCSRAESRAWCPPHTPRMCRLGEAGISSDSRARRSQHVANASLPASHQANAPHPVRLHPLHLRPLVCPLATWCSGKRGGQPASPSVCAPGVLPSSNPRPLEMRS